MKHIFFVQYYSFLFLDKDWILYGFITLGSVLGLAILAGIVCLCIKCIKILNLDIDILEIRDRLKEILNKLD